MPLMVAMQAQWQGKNLAHLALVLEMYGCCAGHSQALQDKRAAAVHFGRNRAAGPHAAAGASRAQRAERSARLRLLYPLQISMQLHAGMLAAAAWPAAADWD